MRSPKVFHTLKVYNNKACIYPDFSDFNTLRGTRETSQENLTNNKSKGVLSYKSKVKICEIVYTWLHAHQAHNYQKKEGFEKIRNQFTFITLTLSAEQIHCDKEIKRKCLMPFLQSLKRKSNFGAYLWVSEKQKNGNIHFHILSDKFIKWQLIKKLWNKAQNNLGYIDQFEKRHKHRAPNSTDIHSLKNINNPAAYITKYFTEEKTLLPQCGRLWNCSQNLKELKPFRTSLSNSECLSILEYSNKMKLEEFQNEYCYLIKVNRDFVHDALSDEIQQEMTAYYSRIYNMMNSNCANS